MLGVHLGFHGEQTVHQLFLTHLQAENGHALSGMESHILGDIQHERRLTHGRPCRDEHQIGGLHTCRPIIQVDEPCGDSRYVSVAVGSLLDLVHGVHDHFPNGHEVSRIPALN